MMLGGVLCGTCGIAMDCRECEELGLPAYCSQMCARNASAHAQMICKHHRPVGVKNFKIPKALADLDYSIVALSPYQFRLDGRVDVYWSKGNRLKRWNIVGTNKRGVLGGMGSLKASLEQVFKQLQ